MATQETSAEAPPAKRRPRFDFKPDIPEVPTIVPSGRHRRTGMVPLYISASKIVRGKDGARYQYTALSLKEEQARAARDGRELTIGCMCFECRRVYDSYEEMALDHSDTDLQMQESDTRHTWAYWCEDKLDPKSPENIEALRNEARGLENAIKTLQAATVRNTDAEEIMKNRERMDKLRTALDATRVKIKHEERNIIGLLSDTKYGA